MPSALAPKQKQGIDINRYLGIDRPQDRIRVPGQVGSPSLSFNPPPHAALR